MIDIKPIVDDIIKEYEQLPTREAKKEFLTEHGFHIKDELEQTHHSAKESSPKTSNQFVHARASLRPLSRSPRVSIVNTRPRLLPQHTVIMQPIGEAVARTRYGVVHLAQGVRASTESGRVRRKGVATICVLRKKKKTKK